jgi:D-hydroxyproline dehydrogenase subunit alpha
MASPEIVIVGAGPAGLAAGIEAARLSASVLVLDEYAQPGGQYYRQLAPGFSASRDRSLFAHAREGQARVEEARQCGVQFLPGALAWGGFADGTIALQVDDASQTLKPAKLILASGAHDRPVAFPGWTLPGVIASGAAQALVRSHGILPGRRILMAGTGPLQIAVAAQLVEAGAQLAGVLEANRPAALLRTAPHFWGQWDRLREGWAYTQVLRAAGVPISFGRTVLRAVGDGEISRVVTAALDERWAPIPGSETELEVDTLCLGFGLVPNTKAARLLGCRLTHDRSRGGLVPVHDEHMQTSRPGVFVAGEAAGIAGAKAAELQGRIAGLSAALALGKGNAAAAQRNIEAARHALRKELRFARVLNETFGIRPGLLALMTDDTIVCRCEEITVGRLRGTMAEWTRTLDAVRTVSRAGFGRCQGTTCETLVAQLLSRETDVEAAEAGHFHVRPPLKPITVGALADLNNHR